ncbi:MAG: hypothetical protein ACQERN_00720 [Thermodesulfobacteriota bacterium]
MKPLTRPLLEKTPHECVARGRWGNADLIRCRRDGQSWMIKDFSPCPSLVKRTWGRWMVEREFRALAHLQGIDGIPEAPFRLDRYAVGYRFIPGKTLKDSAPEDILPDFFHGLEALVLQMHARQMVHLDVRNRRNVLVTDAGCPALLDFQSSLALDHVPVVFHRLLKDIDLSGVYKNWIKIRPDLIDQSRKDRLERINRRRRFWLFKGYMLGPKGQRRP